MSRTATAAGAQLANAERMLAERRFDEAAATLRQALAERPAHAPTLVLLSRALYAGGHYREAQTAALQAHAAKPSRGELLFALARQLALFGEHDALMSCLRHPGFRASAPAQALAEASVLLSTLGENEEARALITVALARDPRHPGALYFSGNLKMFFGDARSAAEDYERCLKVAPHFAQAAWALSGLRRARDDDNQVERMRAQLAKAQPGYNAEIYLNFGLFNELHDLGRHDEAWAALESGCRQKRAKVRYQHAPTLDLLQRIEQACDARFLADAAEGGDAAGSPIFIVGMYRSGTTLLEQILAGHSRVSDGGESFDFSIELRHAADRPSKQVIDQHILEASPKLDFAEIGQRFLHRTEWRKRGRERFTEKLPANFEVLGLIAKALPGARFLHLVRDPVQTCFSNLRVLFNEAAGYSYDQRELAEYYLAYRRLMRHWHACLPGRILDVPFAELLGDTEGTARRVLEFCGLPFEPAVLESRDRGGAVTTASAAQVRGSVDPARAEAWRPYAQALSPLRVLLAQSLPDEVARP
jgi:hypothetical protein